MSPRKKEPLPELDELVSQIALTACFAVAGAMFFAMFWQEMVEGAEDGPVDHKALFGALAEEDPERGWHLTDLGRRLYLLGKHCLTDHPQLFTTTLAPEDPPP